MNANTTGWVAELEDVVGRMMPRLLTQACRDPNSPVYGCFDRDWWHYRIRDFPSIILQQGAYTVWLAGREDPAPGRGHTRTDVRDLAAGACRFWNFRATRHGAFEEYYPFEQGYPPLAFSTLAVAKMTHAGVVAASEILDGLRVAARQLLDRFEPQAANQQVAGLAALAWLRKVCPELVPAARFEAIAGKTLALQTSEGWFMEYGGPDLGYLSVTLDCLWDCLDATGDIRYRDVAAAGLRCIARYVQTLGGGIGMHNARNTDYILPYGIARFLEGETAVNQHPSPRSSPARGEEGVASQCASHGSFSARGEDERRLAERVLEILYRNVGEVSHFLRAMDDRYLSHYAGHSLVRALPLLKAAGVTETAGDRAPEMDLALEQSGHVLQAGGGRRYALILSLKKGGVFTAAGGKGPVSDFGWVVVQGGRQYVNHWWSDDWRWKREGDRFVLQGRMTPHREPVSSPLKHMALRILSRWFGRRLIGPLKNLLIFKKGATGLAFERVVTPGRDSIVVEDRICGVPGGARVVPAPRSSKRHVASADSYHAGDLDLAPGGRREGSSHLEGGVFVAKTVYTVL